MGSIWQLPFEKNVWIVIAIVKEEVKNGIIW